VGAWGAALYSDDTTQEVRDEFKAHLEAGLTHQEAKEEILKRFGEVLGNHQVECLVYFALADTLWKFGCLGEDVKARALALIEAGGDVPYWQEASRAEARTRAKVMAQLKERLLSPQPPLKRVEKKTRRPPRKQVHAPAGTLFGVTLPSGDLALLKFLGLRDGGGNREVGVFCLLPWRGREVPAQDTLERIADQAVTIKDTQQFSLFLSDGRKNPIDCLMKTELVLPPVTPIEEDRHVAVNLEFFPEHVEKALAR
jgi:hypothetical protein